MDDGRRLAEQMCTHHVEKLREITNHCCHVILIGSSFRLGNRRILRYRVYLG